MIEKNSSAKPVLKKSFLGDQESKLEKKKKELRAAKKTYQKRAGEFIDLWVKTKRLKRQAASK